jgi:hypothetical protein
VITLFSIPKPFEGEIATIQLNALRSWVALDGIQVILLGDEPGAAEAAADVGALHIGEIRTSEAGTPLLDDALARVDAVASHPLRCFVNGDILLLDDFLPAVRLSRAAAPTFLMVGSTVDLAVDVLLDLGDATVRTDLRRRARVDGVSRGATAIDYFVFTAGLFAPVPQFVVGRSRFDNWLVWRARQRGAVVDATDAVLAVHQRHDYRHVDGGLHEAHFGAEAVHNLELAGGKRHLYTIHDASHRLAADGRIRRNFGSIGRVRENARKVAWKLSNRTMV